MPELQVAPRGEAVRLKRAHPAVERVFRPAVVLMNQLAYPQKFVLICLLFLLPLGFAMIQLLARFQSDVSLARAELNGDQYLRPVMNLMRHVSEHQALVDGFDGGNIAN